MKVTMAIVETTGVKIEAITCTTIIGLPIGEPSMSMTQAVVTKGNTNR